MAKRREVVVILLFGLSTAWCAVPCGVAATSADQASPANAKGTSEGWNHFDPSLGSGAHCEVEIAVLRPTQFCVGLREVELRAEKLRKMGNGKLDKYLRKKVVPIVIGPGGFPYLVDHHHLARALLAAGVSRTLYAEVKGNWSQLPPGRFWGQMQDHHWVYLFDENASGPLDPAKLPTSIAAMCDDPYRSLAWLVREKGGYRETQDPFAEFAWANFFRTRIRLGNDSGGYDEGLRNALVLVHTSEATNLPGYVAVVRDVRVREAGP